MIEIGVARPSAQGQAIIKTVIVVTIASAVTWSPLPKLIQARKVTTAIIITLGTNMADTLSASRPIAGFEDCALRTISMI